jgi:hypothetical protein
MHSSLSVSSSQQEGNFFASRWIHVPVLASVEELGQLFSLWNSSWLLLLGIPLKREEMEIPFSYFLEVYGKVIEKLKNGEAADKMLLKNILPAAVSMSDEAVYLQEVAGDRYLLKLRKPVMQMQAHFFRFSPIDNSIRSMVKGQDSVFWGIEISYPQIFQNPKTEEIEKSSAFENEKLYTALKKWMRDFTRPTPFILPDGKKMNSPIRIGKSCLSWIAEHPDLKTKGLVVDAS